MKSTHLKDYLYKTKGQLSKRLIDHSDPRSEPGSDLGLDLGSDLGSDLKSDLASEKRKKVFFLFVEN